MVNKDAKFIETNIRSWRHEAGITDPFQFKLKKSKAPARLDAWTCRWRYRVAADAIITDFRSGTGKSLDLTGEGCYLGSKSFAIVLISHASALPGCMPRQAGQGPLRSRRLAGCTVCTCAAD